MSQAGQPTSGAENLTGCLRNTYWQGITVRTVYAQSRKVSTTCRRAGESGLVTRRARGA
jgi:hypothetical protein